MFLDLCSLPWVLGLGSLLLQEKGQVKQLVMEGPWGSPRFLLERDRLVQEPLIEKWEPYCNLHLLPHLWRGLHHLGQLVRLPMEQVILELMELVVAWPQSWRLLALRNLLCLPLASRVVPSLDFLMQN